MLFSRKYHSNLESSTSRAQHIAQRYPAILQDYVGSGWSFDAKLIFFLPQRKSRVWHGDQERADTLQPQRVRNWKQIAAMFRREISPIFISLVCVSTQSAASCLVFQLLVCSCKHDSGRCVPGVGDPGFGSVQHPLVSLLIGCGGSCTRIATIT